MDDNQSQQSTTSTTLKLDGQEVTPEELTRMQEQVAADPNLKLKEVAPGEWRTLNRLND